MKSFLSHRTVALCAVFLTMFFGVAGFSCATRYPNSEAIDVPQDFAGVVDLIDNSDSKSRFLESLGVSWVRADFLWALIEPQPGNWNFAPFDEYIAHSETVGRKVLGILDYETPWIFGSGTSSSYIPPIAIPQFLNYVRTTVARYKRHIGAWEIWNEPNSPYFWRGSAAEFYNLAKLTAQTIRETDPDVAIVIGATSGVPMDWVRGLHSAGGFQNATAYSFHPYWINDEDAIGMIDQAKRLRDELRFQGSLWVTEFGFPSGGGYPSVTNEGEQAARLFRVFTVAASEGMRAVFWYRLTNPHASINTDSSERFFGLAYDDYKEKHAAQAFRAFANNIPGSRYQPNTVMVTGPARSSLKVFPFVKGDKLHVAVWTLTPFPVTLSTPLYVSSETFGEKVWRRQTASVASTLTNTSQHGVAPNTGDAQGRPLPQSILVDHDPVLLTFDYDGSSVPVFEVR